MGRIFKRRLVGKWKEWRGWRKWRGWREWRFPAVSFWKIVFIFLHFLFSEHFVCAEPLQPWTFCYRRSFLEHPLVRGERAFVKENSRPFSQLIFSWNGFRPQHGFFRFWVRVHDVQKGWLSWHKMFEWGVLNGKKIQRSFSDTHADGSYHYVRYEMPAGRLANGFWIKIEVVPEKVNARENGGNGGDGGDGGELKDIVCLSVSVSRLQRFQVETNTIRYGKLPSVFIRGVPIWSQMLLDHPRAPALCSSTVSCMLSSYLGKKTYSPIQFANGVFDPGLSIFGSWQCNVSYSFEMVNGKTRALVKHLFCVQRLDSFGELYKLLRQGVPVPVSVRGVLDGAPKTYPHGHFLLVIGFDPATRMVICHDPAARNLHEVVRKYRLGGAHGFLQAWGNSNNLAYVSFKPF